MRRKQKWQKILEFVTAKQKCSITHESHKLCRDSNASAKRERVRTLQFGRKTLKWRKLCNTAEIHTKWKDVIWERVRKATQRLILNGCWRCDIARQAGLVKPTLVSFGRGRFLSPFTCRDGYWQFRNGMSDTENESRIASECLPIENSESKGCSEPKTTDLW